MSKTKKIILSFLAIIILIIPTLSVGAVGVFEEDINGTTNWGDFSLYVVSFGVKRGNTSNDEGTVSTTVIDNGKRLRINLNSGLGDLKYGDYVNVNIYLRPNNSNFIDPLKSVNGYIEYGIKQDAGNMEIQGSSRTIGSSAGGESAKITDVSTDWGEYYRATFSESSIDKVYDTYRITLYYKVTGYGDSYARYIYLQKADFTVKTKEQYYKEGLNDVIGSHTDSIEQNQNQNTDKITANQDKNTQEIIDNQNEIQENERNEANETGDSGVNDILSVIPNDTDNLLTAFKKLTTSMIHTNTTAKLNFPGIKIPPLKPFTNEEKVLLGKSEIDFEYYFTLIPEKLLTLLRSIFSISLIIYCFKEMYSQLSFIFTAKNGGNDE